MSNIIKSFEDAFGRSKAKGWDRIYVMVDLHGTIFKPCYHNEEKFEYYPWAKKTLQLMSKFKLDEGKYTFNIVLILWTSSTNESLMPYFEKFKNDEINFSYINENPDVVALASDPKSSSFINKYYFNVGLDDKFGFDPEHDWAEIYKFLFNKYHDTI